MSENVIKNKSFDLAVLGVEFYKMLVNDKREFVMSKQFLRSVTSEGANIREAVNAQSKADFIHKLSISQKECDETLYWLELLNATNYISNIEYEPIYSKCSEVLKILRSIIITSKKNS